MASMSMRTSVTSSDEAFPVVLLCSVIVVIVAVIATISILKIISNNHIEKNRKKYFELNKDACSKIEKVGQEIEKMYVLYKGFVRHLGFNREIRCSRSVVSNSEFDMVKYIIKYSNIEYSTDDMEVLEFISQFLSIYYRFIAEAEKTGEQIRRSLPFIVRHFASKKRIVYTVCNIKYELSEIKAPYIRFLYVSPAGRSSYDNKIVLDCGLVKQVANELSKTLSKKGHSKYQRSIMTNDLREAIKKRDNYTCCKCGNSVYKEPNLLLEVDHIIPVSKGGKTEASNLQTLCWRCNREKGNKE